MSTQNFTEVKIKRSKNFLRKEEEEIKRVEKEQKHAEYLARVEKRREKEERIKKEKADREAPYIEEMARRYGSDWYNIVKELEEGRYDSKIAIQLRIEEEIRNEEYEYEQEERERDREEKRDREIYERLERREKEQEEMKKTLTPQEFQQWIIKKEVEDYDDDDIREHECWMAWTKK